jgi:ubiquinone/menaquinone biosynthesis C-methylase UbiE
MTEIVNHAKKTIAYFDDWANKRQDVTYLGYDRQMIKTKIGMLLDKLQKDSWVLDAGCGMGNITRIVSDHCANIVGVDFSKVNIKKANQVLHNRKNAQVVLASLISLPFQDGQFDVVYAFSTLYYVERLLSVLEEFHRTLEPTGLAVLELGNEYSLNALRYRWQNGVIQYLRSPKQMNKIIENSLFCIKERRIFGLIHIPKILERFFCWKIGNRLVEEWVSSAPLLRLFAFRYLSMAERAS